MRQWTAKQLEELGFTVLPSCANFLFARSESIGGGELYQKLKQRGILVRHFTAERIKEFNRITIGTQEQMETFIQMVKDILNQA